MRDFFSADIRQILAHAIELAEQYQCAVVNPALFILSWLELSPSHCPSTAALFRAGANLERFRKEAQFHLEKLDSEGLSAVVLANFEQEISIDLRQLFQTSFGIARSLSCELITLEHVLLAVCRGKNKAATYLIRSGCDIYGLGCKLWGLRDGSKLETPADNLLAVYPVKLSEQLTEPTVEKICFEQGLVKLAGFSEDCSAALRLSLDNAGARNAGYVEVVDLLRVLCATLPYPYLQIAAKNELSGTRIKVVTNPSPEIKRPLLFLISFSSDLQNILRLAREMAEQKCWPQVEIPHLFYAVLIGAGEDTKTLLSTSCNLEALTLEVEEALDGVFNEAKDNPIVDESGETFGCTMKDALDLPLSVAALAMLIHAGRFTFMLKSKSAVEIRTLLFAFCQVEARAFDFKLDFNRILMDWDKADCKQGDLLALPVSEPLVKVLREAARVALGAPGTLITPAHVLLAMTRLPQADFLDALADIPVSNLQVKVFLDYLFEHDKLVWKPPLQLVAKNKNPASKSNPEPEAGQTKERSLPDNCSPPFVETLARALVDGQLQGLELTGITRLLNYVLSSELIQLTEPVSTLDNVTSEQISERTQFTGQVYDFLQRASFRARNLGLPLNHWIFLYSVAVEMPYVLRNMVPCLNNLAADALKDAFKRRICDASEREALAQSLRADLAAWAGFDAASAGIWRQAEMVISQKNLAIFRDEFLLLEIFSHLTKTDSLLLPMLNIQRRSVERLANKLNRPENLLSLRQPSSIDPLEIIMRAGAIAHSSGLDEINTESLLLALCSMSNSNSAWILGNLLINDRRLEEAITSQRQGKNVEVGDVKLAAYRGALPSKGAGLYKLEEALKCARESASATKYGEIRAGHLFIGLIYTDKQLAECLENCTGYSKDQFWNFVCMHLYPEARGPYHDKGIINSDEVDEVLQQVHGERLRNSEAYPLELIDVFDVVCTLSQNSVDHKNDVHRLFESLELELETIRQNVLASYVRLAS